MTITNDHLEPAPEFLAHLEWQMASQVRRAALAPARPARRRRRLVGLVALACLASSSLGAAGAIAISGPSRASLRLLEVRAEADVKMARATEAFVTDEHARAAALVEAGRESAAALDEIEQRRIDARLERRLEESRAREVGVRRGAPIDQLGASVTDAGDFVTERLTLRLEAAHEHEVVGQRQFQVAERLARGGFLPSSELRARVDVVEARRRAITCLDALLDLRARVVAGTLAPAQAELRGRRLERERDLADARDEQRRIADQVARAAQLVSRGVASPGEARALEQQHRLATIRVNVLDTELALLDEMLAELDRSTR